MMNQNWEWRIFYQQGSFDLWKHLIDYNNQNEKLIDETLIDDRPDFYLDLQAPEFGLKERWDKDEITGGFQPKLELKVRLQKNKRNSAELWIKTVKERITEQLEKNKGLTPSQVQRYLHQAISEADSKISSTIQTILSMLDEVEPRRILVDKQRKQLRGRLDEKKNYWMFYPSKDRENAPLENPNVVLVEQTTIKKIQFDNRELDRICTVCFEAQNLQIIEKFKQTFISRNLIIQGQVMGYPEHLMKVFN